MNLEFGVGAGSSGNILAEIILKEKSGALIASMDFMKYRKVAYGTK